VAITGIPYTDGECEYVITACADRASGKHALFAQKKIGASYPGTGELFSSVLLGLTLDGEDFFSASEFSGKFVADTIRTSEEYGDATRHGTALEPALMKLSHDMYEKLNKQ
jgi:pyridoxal/pyridoxine/pyridoxamine kinase